MCPRCRDQMSPRFLACQRVARGRLASQVVVEGESPLLKKGAIKPVTIEMKRAAGHNKTHVSGLESFLVSPDAVAQAPESTHGMRCRDVAEIVARIELWPRLRSRRISRRISRRP